MDTKSIVDAIDAEIACLQQVKALLGGGQPFPKSPTVKATYLLGGGEPFPKSLAAKAKRIISAEGRARMAAAQQARWAKAKR